MASKKLAFLACMGAVFGAEIEIKNWNDIPLTGISTDMVGNFTYDASNAQDFILKGQIFFVAPESTLKINAKISGAWDTQKFCGLVMCLGQGKPQTGIEFNKGNLLFNITLDPTLTAQGEMGIFSITKKSELTINSNLTINLNDNAPKLSEGIFFVSDSTLNITDAHLKITTPNQTLFDLKGKSSVFLNKGGNYANQRIVLEGGLRLSDNAELGLKLGNQSSRFVGEVSLDGASKLNFDLLNSSAEITHYTQAGGTSAVFELQSSSLTATLANAQKTELRLSSNSVWNVRESSQVGTIALKNSYVNLLNDRLGQAFVQKTLDADEVNGNGAFALYADVSLKEVDTMTLAKASGNHQIHFFYNPTTFTQDLAQNISEADKLVVATTQDASSEIFVGGNTEMGLTSYKTNLVKNANQWLISSIVPDGDSRLSRVLSTALNTPYRLFDATHATLYRRLGDLRDYPRDYGLYARYIVGLGNLSEGKNTFATKDLWMSFAGGFDMNKLYRNRVDFLGAGFEVNLMDSKNSAYASSSQAYGANVYYASIFDFGFYYDVALKYAFSPTSFDFNGSNNLVGKASLNAHLISLGLEVGQKIGFGSRKENRFYLEPQGRVTSGVILPINFAVNDVYGERIGGEVKMQIPLIAKGSIYVGYEWNEGFRGDVKLGGFVEYAMSNGGDILLRDSRSHLKKTFSGDLDVGISAVGSIEVGESWRFYSQIDSAFLGDYASNIAFNMGLRWSFGERYVPPPPPPADPERLKIRYKYGQKKYRTIPVVQEDDVNNMKHYERREVMRDHASRPIAPPSQGMDQNRNENRFYPRNTGNLQSQPIKRYNRTNARDGTIPPQGNAGVERRNRR